MKSISKLIVFLLFYFPTLVFAEADTKSLLQPTNDDKSIFFLQSMFGQVDGVLHGGGSLVLGSMLNVLNSIFLILASIVLVYILIVSTVNTAHEGEALGKKWSTVWVPIRLVTSITLLIPKATGYSMIQILVMWIVVQGVGLADNVWKTALTYFFAGGNFIHGDSGSQYASTGGFGAESLTAKLLKSQICMFKLEKSLNAQRPKGSAPLNFASTVEIRTLPVDSSGKVSSSLNDIVKWYSYVEFPGNLSSYGTQYTKYEEACGLFDWSASARTTTAGRIAINQLILGTQAIARNIAYNDSAPATMSTQMLNTAKDYMSIMATVGDYNTPPAALNYDNAVKDGWMMAGSYFRQFTTNYRAAVNKGDMPTPAEVNAVCDKTGDDEYIRGAIDLACKRADIKNSIAGGTSEIAKYLSSKTDAQASSAMIAGDQITRGLSLLSEYVAGPVIVLALGPLAPAFNPIATGVTKLIQAIAGLFATNYSMHPVTPMVTLGEALINIANGLITASTGMAFTSALAAVFPAVNPIGFGIVAVATIISTFVNVLSDYLYITGVMLAYYLPAVPSIIFTFGILGWLVAILESIIAAPLVALGIASPGSQHELLGKSEPAVMLILNVFLRPTLMVMGFIMGILLSAVGMWIFNQVFGFGPSLGLYMAEKFEPSINGLVMTAIFIFVNIGIYVITATVIFQRSFSLIHILPDNIMRWLAGGAQAQFGSEFRNADSETKQGFQESSRFGATGLRGVSESAMGTSRAIEGHQDRSERKLQQGGKSGGSAGGIQQPNQNPSQGQNQNQNQ